MSILTELPKSLRSAIRRHRVPGASLAVYRNGRVTEAAAGVLNVETEVKTTTDSVFQIGSISKVLTTTLVMQMVDDGLVDLEAPLVDYLADFQVFDGEASRAVTVRQLLCHTGGFEGDLFVDSGRGDDCVARLQDMGRLLPQLFPPGERLSYCNFGFAMLGRMLEVVSGKTYDALLAERIFRPLGMHHALSLPEDCVKYRCAIGHVPDPKHKGAPMLSPMPWLSQGQKAAGATPSMSAGDLLRFVAMHLDGGTSRDGERLLSRSSVRKMQQRQIRLPRGARLGVSGWGLGWILDDWSGHKVFGHDGGTVGQYSFLRVLPEKNLAVALLTNGGDAMGLYEETFTNLFQALARVTLPTVPEPVPLSSTMRESLPGHYENLTGSIDIVNRRNELAVRITPKPGLTAGVNPTNAPLQALSRNLLQLVSDDIQAARTTVAFEGESEGRAEFVRMGMRLYKRC
jgi:CubicO group peptidase (beta-lactamase class C family)